MARLSDKKAVKKPLSQEKRKYWWNLIRVVAPPHAIENSKTWRTHQFNVFSHSWVSVSACRLHTRAFKEWWKRISPRRFERLAWTPKELTDTIVAMIIHQMMYKVMNAQCCGSQLSTAMSWHESNSINFFFFLVRVAFLTAFLSDNRAIARR